MVILCCTEAKSRAKKILEGRTDMKISVDRYVILKFKNQCVSSVSSLCNTDTILFFCLFIQKYQCFTEAGQMFGSYTFVA